MNDLIAKIKARVTANGYERAFPAGISKEEWYPILFSHEFAQAFWGKDEMRVGKIITNVNVGLPKWLHCLKAMATYGNPFEFLKRFFIEVEPEHYDQFAFGRDIFLHTDYPCCTDSKDEWSPREYDHLYHYKPLSLVADFHDGTEMAADLLKMFPDKKKLLDLGTATGSVPLTMRRAGMLALGLEGLPVMDFEIENFMMQKPDLFCWNVAPELVETADITMPFHIKDAEGNLVKFDYIISTDCFEHLVTGRISNLLYNINNHLAEDGFGIFEINANQWMEIHQSCFDRNWWKEQLNLAFVVDENLSKMDFRYVRSNMKGGKLAYKTGEIDAGKMVIWVRKK